MTGTRCKIGLLVFPALAFLASIAYAADNKIYLACTGTISGSDPSSTTQDSGESIVVDLDRGIVSGSIGSFSIVEKTESTISFESDREEKHKIGEYPFVDRIHTAGNIDRILGHVQVYEYNNDGLTTQLKLNCRQTSGLRF
jgi:hypothetical protein